MESSGKASVQVWLSLAILATGVSTVAYLRLLPKARALLRGERGERRVADELQKLYPLGYRCFHDVQRNGFNIDHVVVGPAGVFAIETKFRSGAGTIEFRDDEGLFVGGYPDERDSLRQARGNAAELNRFIRDNCQMEEWVVPLLVFVGEWRVRDRWNSTDARVFTPGRLVKYIADQQPHLRQSDIRLIASHLERSAKG